MSFDWGSKENFSTNKNRTPRVSDFVEMLDLSDGDWHAVRMIGNTVLHKIHWINIRSPKTGKKVGIPKMCLSYDPKNPTEERSCPYCEAFGPSRSEAYINVIDRDLQDNPPAKIKPRTKYEDKLRKNHVGEFFFKEGKESKSYTPARVLRVTSTVGEQIADLVSLNKVKSKKTGVVKKFPPDDPKYGFDISIKYNKDSKTPSGAYNTQKGERNTLSEEELDELLWVIPEHSCEDEAVAKREAEQLKKLAIDKDGKPMYPELAKGDKKKKRGEYSDQFDEDDDVEDDDRKKKKSKSKKASRDDDDEDDMDYNEDDDEDDEDEDDRPRSKKSKSKKSSKSRRRNDDDDIPF